MTEGGKSHDRPSRRGLPKGKWSTGGEVSVVVHRDMFTGDSVKMMFVRGDVRGSPVEYWGCPPDTDPANVWHLRRTEPRTARAWGGTPASLNYLTTLADEDLDGGSD